MHNILCHFGGKKTSTLDPVISSSFLVFPFLVSLPLCARIQASRCTHELKMSLNIMNHKEIVTLIKFLPGFKVLHAVAPLWCQDHNYRSI